MTVRPQPAAKRRAGTTVERVFPRVPAMVVRDGDGFALVPSFGRRWHVSGPLCRDLEESLVAGAATPGLVRLAGAHPALAEVVKWLETPAVPLTREGVVRQDGFDTLFLELLGRCNERCVHCYADSSPTVEDALEKDVVLRVIDEAAEAGFQRIQFTGGDPLLCPFLPEAVARAAARGIPSREIYTNALALSDALLDELAPSAPSFAVSFYSRDPVIHDGITRTPGSHKRTLAGIDRAVARGLKVRAAIVVMAENAGEVDDIIDFLKARGVTYVSWSRTFAVGRGNDIATANPVIKTPPRPADAEEGGHTAPTEGARHGKLCVSYTGDVIPCIFQRQSVLGNVRSGRSLADIVAGEDALAARGPRRTLPVAEAPDGRPRIQCASCRVTDMALGYLAGNGAT